MMTEEQIQQAVEAARQARREFFAGHDSVRAAFMRMFKHYNVKVFIDEEGLRPRMNGDTYILSIPEDTNPNLDNYDIAHEMGHIILGHDIFTMRNTNDMSDENRMADIFAVNLLMPEKEFREECRKCSNDVCEVANKFGVMPSFAYVRMAILGIGEEE